MVCFHCVMNFNGFTHINNTGTLPFNLVTLGLLPNSKSLTDVNFYQLLVVAMWQISCKLGDKTLAVTFARSL